MDIFYRSLFTRGRKPRRARKILIIAALAALPALAASTSQALGTPSIVTASTQDDNANGRLDKIRVVFSTAMDQTLTPKISTGVGSPGIRIDGYQIDTSRGTQGFTWSGSQTLDVFLVEGSAPDTGVKPTLYYEQGGNVQSAPPAPGELAATERATTDAAGPVLVRVTSKAVRTLEGVFKYSGDELFIDFSEPTTLSGSTKTDRWSNLERAIKFINDGGGCPTDGDGTNSRFNFPQPVATRPTGADPIVAPSGSAPEQRFHIRFAERGADNGIDQLKSLNPFPAIPAGCWVGVDAGTQVADGNLLLNRSVLRDAANNIAQASTVATQVRIFPSAIELQTATTRDLNRDGEIDAVALTFSQNIDADSIAQTFTVRNTGTSVQSSSVEVGAAANILIARFDGPAGWDTLTTPTISYTKPDGCGTESGSGLQVTYGNFRLCVESFTDVQTTDGAGPVLVSASTATTDGDGKVDAIRLTFNEAVADTPAESDGWTVNGQTVTMQIDPDDGRLAKLVLGEQIADTASRPTVSYASPANPMSGSMDISGNQVGAVSELAALDGTAPWITSAAQQDVNGDGNIDRAVLTYSEALLDPANANGFTIGGQPATLVAPSGDDAANDATLTLAVSGLTGTDTKEIAFTPGATVRDAAGNASGAQTIIATDVIDEAAPRASVDVDPSAPIPAGESTIVVTFTEPMDTSVAPTVTFTTELGPKTVTAVGFDPDGRAWEGTIQVVEADCTVSTGCPVTASASGGADPAGNPLGAPASLTTEIDTVAPTPPVIGSFAAVLPADETAPGNTLNMFASDFSVTASIVAGEASPGVATVLLDGEPLAGAIDSAIGAGDTSISAATAFGSASALQDALDEGSHTLAIELCDDAGNCSATETALEIVSDYTPDLGVTLTSPAGGDVIGGGSSLDVVWDGADGDGFDHVTLSYSTNGGTTFPNVIAAGLSDRDGTRAWSVPQIDSQNVVVRAALADAHGNKSFDLSDPFVVRTNPVFSDVSASHWARPQIEAIYDAGITTGCGGGKYCPNGSVTRAQMAVFLVRALGEDDNLGTYQGLFTDVPSSSGYALFIEKLADLGITGGCGGGKFCPSAPVTRGQMAVFLVRALGEDDNLGSYQGKFIDVPSTNSFALFIEKLADMQITSGCGGGKFCPGSSVTRGQMAVFMQKAWNLPMLG